MKKIILIVLTAALLLASNATITKETTQEIKKEGASLSLNERLKQKQVVRAAKITAIVVKKELARVEKTKLREAKIKQVDSTLKEKAQHRAEA